MKCHPAGVCVPVPRSCSYTHACRSEWAHIGNPTYIHTSSRPCGCPESIAEATQIHLDKLPSNPKQKQGEPGACLSVTVLEHGRHGRLACPISGPASPDSVPSLSTSADAARPVTTTEAEIWHFGKPRRLGPCRSCLGPSVGWRHAAGP